ncbi:MAG: hypothetical protein ACOVOG_00545, partial [Rubrivivax sp.]
MSPPSSPPAPQEPPVGPGSAWGRHLFDYPPAAPRLWWLITLGGAAALVAAVLLLLHHTPQVAQTPALLLAGLALVALAAMFPVQIPRTRYTLIVADIFIFLLLVQVGPPAAVLAAGVEALIGVKRSSKRLSSHISGPAAALVAMALGAVVFVLMSEALALAGLSAPNAALLALCLAAPVPVMLSTGLLMVMFARKRGEGLALADWWSSVTWIVALA